MLMRGKQQPQKRKTGKKLIRKDNKIPRNPSNKTNSVAAAYSTGTSGRSPIIRATRDSCRIQHREFIGNVTGTVAFNVTKFVMNPGLVGSFPWLSTIASSWEEYKFRNLKIRYLTRTGSATPGSVIIAPDYDASDDNPSSETTLATYQDARGDAPWKDMEVKLQRLDLSGPVKRHFVRNTALAANQDIKLYDVANLFVATTDGTAVAWGKLWIEYDVEFFVPQLPPSGAVQLRGGLALGNGTVTKANPFGTGPLLDPELVGFTIGATSILQFLGNGNFLLAWNVIGTVIVASVDPVMGAGVAIIAANTSEDIDAGGLKATKRITVLVSDFATSTINFGGCYAGSGSITAIRLNVGTAPLNSFG